MNYSKIVSAYKEYRRDVGQIKVKENIHNFFDSFDKEDLVNFMNQLVSLEDSDNLFRTPHSELKKSLTTYLTEVCRDNDELFQERIFAGVLAFIQTMEYGEPYPFMMYGQVEEKKWWQFWK